jgi:hypothetical protein
VKLLAVLALVIAPSCWGERTPSLAPRHLAYIRAETFTRVNGTDEFPPAVRSLLSDVPFRRVAMAGCSATHCIVEYESAEDRGILEVEVFGLSEKGAAGSEWRSFEETRARNVNELKRMVTDR